MLRPISNIVPYPVANSNRSGQLCMLVIAVLLVGCIRDKDTVTSAGREQSP